MFASCDWGTSHFRLLAASDGGTEILARFESAEGVGPLADSNQAGGAGAPRFRAVLEQALRQLSQRLGAPLGSAPVMISGMASSSIGWQELPYAAVPLSLDGANLVWRELEGPQDELGRRRVILISGLRTTTDVMRGEETQALGLFQLPAARALTDRSLIVMPGTHSKHIEVAAGQIRRFQTFMTGELFDVLARHSILQHSLAAKPALCGDWDADGRTAFRAGIDQACQLGLPAALFRVRTRQLLDRLGRQSNRSFLSGVLIGCELAHLRHDRFSGQPILLCASPPLDALYVEALEALGLADQLRAIPPGDVERLSALGQAVLLRHIAGL